jgi:hypothetical protein
MKYLVFCTCSHNLEKHSPEGCSGDRDLGCPCRLDQVGALNAAIERARNEATAIWRKPEDETVTIGGLR